MDYPLIRYCRKDGEIPPIQKKTLHDGSYNLFWPYADSLQPYEVKLVSTGLCFFLPDTMAGIIFKEVTNEDIENRSNLNVWTNVIHGGSGGELVVYLENKSNLKIEFNKNAVLCSIMFVCIERTLPKEILPNEVNVLTSTFKQMEI